MKSKKIVYTTYITEAELFSHEDWETTVSGSLLMSLRDMKKKVEIENYVMDLTTLKVFTEWGSHENEESPTFNYFFSIEANSLDVDSDEIEW